MRRLYSAFWSVVIPELSQLCFVLFVLFALTISVSLIAYSTVLHRLLSQLKCNILKKMFFHAQNRHLDKNRHVFLLTEL